MTERRCKCGSTGPFYCAYCHHADRLLTQDHVIPISKGGGHTAENVVPACKPCNSKKKDRSVFVMLPAAA